MSNALECSSAAFLADFVKQWWGVKGPWDRLHRRRKETEDAYIVACSFVFVVIRVRLLYGEDDAAGSLDFVLFFLAFTLSESVDLSELRGTDF